MSQEHDVKRLHVPSGLSVASAELIDYLREAAKDGKESLTDEEMTSCCGKETKVGGKGYNNLRTAMRYVLAHDRIHWERVNGANLIKQQAPEETITVAEAYRKRIHRMTKQGLRKLATVNPDQLPEGERASVNAKVAVLGILDWMSNSSTRKKIEARSTADQKMDLPKLLDALK